MSSGPPLHAPLTAYIHNLLDKFGPIELSSFHQSTACAYSAHFVVHTHAAAADWFFTRFSEDGSAKGKGICHRAVFMLVGNATYIYSPSSGRVMNLGLRDVVFLRPAIASHIKLCQSSASVTSNSDIVLLEFAVARRAGGLKVIRMTKGFLNSIGVPAVEKKIAT